MKFADLVKFKNTGKIAIPESTFQVARTGGSTASIQESSFGIGLQGAKALKLLGEPNLLALTKSASGEGMWVPYLAGRSVYGFLSGAQTWAASGPYSGCYFEVGKLKGRIYVAHISCEGATDPNVEAWKGASAMSGKQVLYSKKIGMARDLPAGATNVATIVFADIAGDTVSVTRVDVQTASAGGMSGPIFDVKQIDAD